MAPANNSILPRSFCAAVLAVSATTSLQVSAADFPSVSSVYTHYSADSASNVTVAPLNQTFTSANVDVAGQKLTGLPDLGFAAVTRGQATPVYFSSTGTLPAPLKPNTPYYIVASAGGYKVFPVATDADAAFQPGGIPGEKVHDAQNAYQGVLNVVLSDGGTGTHTISTKKLLQQLTDQTANGFHSVASGSTRHALLEMDTDANGNWFFKTLGAVVRENFVGSYNGYGPTFYQVGEKYAARQKIGDKRVVYQIFVCRVRSFKERQVMKVLDGPTHVDSATDQINYGWDSRMSGKVATGDLINIRGTEGSVLPAPLAEGQNYFARKVDTKFMTLHPTAADATANTNAIDITSTGSGSFLFSAPLRVGDARRWSFFAEVLEPGSGGGNTLSARLNEPMPSGASLLKNSSTVFNANGNVTGFALVPDLTPVVFWAPPGATLAAPLRAGVTYWSTKTPGSSSTGRLHATFASAKESVGVATAASSCIKFTTAGTGECLVSHDDGASDIAFGTLTSSLEPLPIRVPLGPLCILVFKIDFNDPDPGITNAVASLGVNEPVTATRTLSLTKGNTPTAVSDTSKAWTLFNSAQGHVPIDMDCYEIIFGSSTENVPDSDLQSIVDFLKSKYKVGNPSPTALRTWRNIHFGISDPVGVANDTGDPDGDGRVNLMEYAAGSNPLISNTGPIAVPGLNGDGSRLTLTFPRIADPALHYACLASGDLAAWQSIWSSSGVSNMVGDSTVEDIASLSDGSRRFLRLNVSY